MAGVCQAGTKACPPRDAAAAETAIEHAGSWKKLEAAYMKFRHCDGGELAQGNSEAVAELLAEHWSTLPALTALIRQNPAFRRFVLRHIEAGSDREDLESIQTSAATQCPSGSESLCDDIKQAAARALR